MVLGVVFMACSLSEGWNCPLLLRPREEMRLSATWP